MSSESFIQIKLRINYIAVLTLVALIHFSLMIYSFSPDKKLISSNQVSPDSTIPLKIRRIKTPKVENSQIKTTQSFINDSSAPAAKKEASSPVALKDLALRETLAKESTPALRPGSRPDSTRKRLAMSTQPKINQIKPLSLRKEGVSPNGQSFPSGGISISDMVSTSQKIQDAVVSIEVPDGVHPDELNEYELMFYSFQKRTALNYINSILRNIDKFQKKYPHYKIPTDSPIKMTARVSYDSEGNVLQIKMIRWTQVNEIQGLFEDIVKQIDQLHNPPKKLWERNNEFAMFYTLEII